MSTTLTHSDVSVRGRVVRVPALRIGSYEIVAIGRWPRLASVRDEEWLEAAEQVDPLELAQRLSRSPLAADIFVFSGELDRPLIDGVRHEADNVAVIETHDFKAWWDGLPQEARKNTRRAAKRGIEIRPFVLDDAAARGIKAIYDETPLRQGRPFWHYGKDLETIRRENDTYKDRSEFLGAYLGAELVGFMKWVYVGNTARIMQILCLNAHQDKRPIIALIAKAAEACHEKGMRYLVYGKYTYGKKADSSIAEFKKRLGFVQKEFPRYFVPLTLRGRVAIASGVHLGYKNLLPASLLKSMLDVRARWLTWRHRTADAQSSTE